MTRIEYRLRDDVRLDLAYEDRTSFGSVVSGAAEANIWRACAAIAGHRAEHGMADVVACSNTLLSAALSGPLAPFFAKAETLREDCLFPPAEQVEPALLHVRRGGELLSAVPLAGDLRRELARWVGELYRGMSRPAAAPGRLLFDALETCGALTRTPRDLDPPPPSALSLFVGHATVAVGTRVLFDPFLAPKQAHYLASYRPLTAADLQPVGAVFITHSHPDHFDIGSLLAFGADTPIYVPSVERESLLAVDMAYRLAELGFSRVERVTPGASVRVNDASVHALPFFGEQPTTGPVLHPEVRNTGCTYLVEVENQRVLLVADSGRDREGDVREVAAVARRQFGDVSILYSGYRAFAVYPIHYLFSSVARYLLFVPKSEWGVRQKTMNDADDLLDTAERAGARCVVPYADGGAPWHWERGLGPRLDGHGVANPAIDSPPERVESVAAQRSSARDGPIGSPVRVVVLRPGETLTLGEGTARDLSYRIDRGPHQFWPYGTQVWTQANVALARSDGSAAPSARRALRAVEPLVARWRADGRLEHFHFMRKPPDLRLRLFGDPTLAAELGAVLDERVRDGCVVRWFPSIYEPEIDRFGGHAAQEAAFAWFDVDTTNWLLLDHLRTEGRQRLTTEDLCLAVANDLVFGAVDGRGEAWAVWRIYANALGLAPTSETARGESPLGSMELAGIIAGASAEESLAVESYRAANRTFATALRAIWEEGSLTRGIRAVVADAILFLFHRHGLSPSMHAHLVQTMMHALEPASRPGQSS